MDKGALVMVEKVVVELPLLLLAQEVLVQEVVELVLLHLGYGLEKVEGDKFLLLGKK